MSCKHCAGHAIKGNAPLVLDDGSQTAYDQPVEIFWPYPVGSETIDYAEHAPRVYVPVLDDNGDETSVCFPIRFCPICGEKLTGSDETFKWWEELADELEGEQ